MVNSIFQNVQGLRQRRRAYNMSYRNDYTACLGELVPVYIQDLIPDSSILIRPFGLVRLNPMIAPIMDNLDFYFHCWQAPRRILEGEQFTDMITGETPDEEIDLPFFVPNVVHQVVRGYAPTPEGFDWDQEKWFNWFVGDGSLVDMLGYDKSLFPTYDAENDEWIGGSSGKLNARKWIMYARLLVQWYTNENVEPWNGCFDELEAWCNPKSEVHGDISEQIGYFIVNLYNAFGSRFMCHAWAKEYFTSALPSLQYGMPTYLPLGDSAPVQITGGSTNVVINDPQAVSLTGQDGQPVSMSVTDNPNLYDLVSDDAYLQTIQGEFSPKTSGAVMFTGQADLREATSITINELRVANALQVFKEREMKFGRRAPEYYKGFYGIRPRDMRLQIPEYIGGGKFPIMISDIEQTSQTTSESPLGELAGKGTGISAAFASCKCFVPEESIVFGVAWAMPKITYANLLSRHDTKLNDRFEYYNPSFAHIGEQEVYNYEIFAGSYGSAIGQKEFGYQPRYTEYRFHASELHGDFKSSLSFWTLGRVFTQQPALNPQFIYMQPKALSRIFAVQTDTFGRLVPNMKVSLKFNVSLIQPLSRYGTPSLIV